MAIDCRALCSQDIDITIPKVVAYEPKIPLKWQSCNNRGEKKKAVLYLQHHTRRTFDHMHEVDIIES